LVFILWRETYTIVHLRIQLQLGPYMLSPTTRPYRINFETSCSQCQQSNRQWRI
jgi:hypothetical protein